MIGISFGHLILLRVGSDICKEEQKRLEYFSVFVWHQHDGSLDAWNTELLGHLSCKVRQTEDIIKTHADPISHNYLLLRTYKYPSWYMPASLEEKVS